MITLIIFTIAIGLSVFLLYKRLSSHYELFEKQGLKYLKPIPLLGSTLDTFKGIGIADRIRNTYNKFPNEKIIGLFDLHMAIYVLRTPEVIKKITIKDFSYFQDRMALIDPSVDDFMGKMLFSLRGKEWRDMRASLSPLFTGSKMRMMFGLITKCAQQLVNHLKEDYKQNGAKPLQIKDLFSRYTNDSIATCAFGVECNSLQNPDNEIYKTGQNLLNFQKSLKMFNFVIMRCFPKLANILRLKIIDPETKKKFTNMILNTMEIRHKEGIVRPDILQLMMKFKYESSSILQEDEQNEIADERKSFNGEIKQSWTDIELIAQCFIFFLAGFDTSATAMTYTAYELAVNPEIQSKLLSEVDAINESLNGGALTYEAMHKMKYLDMVITEVLRKWPTSIATDRECMKDYYYEDEDGLKFTIEKGSMIWIPIYAIHMDPKYFPSPEKFDPERFSDENKANMDMITFLSFGVGPRICLGLRFALMEIKVLFYYLLSNYKIKVCEETDVPLKLKNSIMGLVPNKEIKLSIEPRNKADN